MKVQFREVVEGAFLYYMAVFLIYGALCNCQKYSKNWPMKTVTVLNYFYKKVSVCL